MPESDDIALLKQFAENGSETAFAGIVSRHLNLVYSTALRAVGNAHAAQEISQAVFIILARKANKLTRHAVLSGWLYQTAWLTAANYLRGEIRRQKREQEAYMQAILNEPESEAWLEIAPLLDDAMGRLGEKDRNAIVLRFFENKNLREVGLALGASEDAAKMRVNRALEKLRKIFSKRGVASTTAIIAGAVSANSVQAAPVGLAKTISAVAIAKGAAAGGSTLALVKGALKIMVWTKAKTAIVAGVGLLLVAGTTTVTVEKIHQRDLDAQWDTGQADSQILARLPHIVRIIPTRFPNGGRSLISGSGSIGHGLNVREMLQAVYGSYYNRTIFLTSTPPGRYDFIANLPSGSSVALGKEMQKELGIVGRVEAVETNVLFLKVSRSGVAGLVPTKTRNGSPSINGRKNGEVKFIDVVAGSIADISEQECKIPVIDQTGLNGRYDIDLKWNNRNDPQHENFKQVLNDQLGLELVPGTAPVKFLFIEKSK